MKRVISIVAGIGAMWLASVSFAQVTEITGNLGSNSNYHIKVPTVWNGDLVIWNHGFSLGPPEEIPHLGSLADLQLAEGYAVAASSYRLPGRAGRHSKQALRAGDEVTIRVLPVGEYDPPKSGA